MKHIAFIFSLVSIVGCNSSSSGKHYDLYQGRVIDSRSTKMNGYVPNTATAIRIAEAVWRPIYGDDIVEEKPFRARLINDTTWLVNGTLHTEVGGVAFIKIDKKTGAIREVYHEK